MSLQSQIQELRSLMGWSQPATAPAAFEAVDTAALGGFLKSLYPALVFMQGREYASKDGTVKVSVDSLYKPMRDPLSDGIEFVVPLVVRYEGESRVPPEIWAEAEKAMEREVTDAVMSMASDALGGAVTLLSRTKADPYPDDPKTMTMLRFRVG